MSDELEAYVAALHRGPCPTCGGPGPVDVAVSPRLLGLDIVHEFEAFERICCGRCHTWVYLGGAVQCGVFGWWTPFTVFRTPDHIARNLWKALRGERPGPVPSPKLTLRVATAITSFQTAVPTGARQLATVCLMTRAVHPETPKPAGRAQLMRAQTLLFEDLLLFSRARVLLLAECWLTYGDPKQALEVCRVALKRRWVSPKARRLVTVQERATAWADSAH